MTKAQKFELTFTAIAFILLFVALWWWRMARIEDCMAVFEYTYEQCAIITR